MWIAKAAEVKEKQSILRVNKRELTAADLPERKKADKAGEKDTLILSAEGLKKQKDEQEKTEEKTKENIQLQFLEEYRKQLESSKKSSKHFQDLAKILEIARRIAHGDKVPATDEKKLMEFSSDLYQAAKSAAMLNADKKHKKYKSLFEEEEESKQDKLRGLEQEGSQAVSAEAEAPAEESAAADRNMEGIE